MNIRKKRVIKAGRDSSFRTFDVTANGKVMDIDAKSFEDAARQVASWVEFGKKRNIITVADRRTGNTRSYEVIRKGAIRDVTGDTLEDRQAMGASTSTKRKFTVKATTLGDLYEFGYDADGIIESVFTAIQRDLDNQQIDATSIMVSSIARDRSSGVVFIDVMLSSRVNRSVEKYIAIEANVKDNQFEIYDLDNEKFIASCNMDEQAAKTISRVIEDEAEKLSKYADTVGASTSTKRKRTIKAASNRNDFVRKLNKVYQAYMAIETDADLRKSGMTHAEWEALPEVFKKLQADGWAQTIMSGLAEFFKRNGFSIHMDKNNVNYIIVAADEYVPASTSTKRKFTVKASEDLSGTYYITYNGNIIEETDGTGDAGEEALAEVFAMDKDALDAAAKYLNSFGDELVYNRHEVDENGHEMSWIEDGGEWDPDDVARTLAQFIQMEYDEGQMDPTYFGSEIYWDGGRIEWFDSADLAESNNVDEWIENTDLNAEDLDLDIDSAQSVECATGTYEDFDETMRFRVVSYFGNNFTGISDDATFDDLSEAESQAHEWLAQGPVSIEDYYVGRIDIDPDEYWDAFENAAEFACTPAIAEWQDDVWKSMGIGASQSVKCSESIMAFQDSLTDELYRVAEQEILQTSKLASYDPYVSIDEDSFECTFTGTAWGTYLQYGIRFDAHSDKFDFKNYFDWDKIEREQLSWLDPDSDTCFATVRFFISVDGSKVHADVEDVIVTRDGQYSEWDTEQYKNIIDFDKFGEAIVQFAEPVIQDIHYTLSQFEPDLYEEGIESSTSIQAEHTTLRDRDITSADDVRELVLYITNDGDLYRQRTTPIIENLKRKVKKGNYDRDLAVKAWQYLADDGVRKYDKEFGSGRGSLTLLDKATREEIARELRDYYEEEVMWDVNHPESSDDLTTV